MIQTLTLMSRTIVVSLICVKRLLDGYWGWEMGMEMYPQSQDVKVHIILDNMIPEKVINDP